MSVTVPATTEETLEPAVEVITTFQNYGLTWLMYIGLTLLMVGILWYAFRKWHFLIKWFFASVIFTGALTPAHPVENTTTYSPLVLNSTVSLFDGDKTSFMAGLQTIIIVWVIVFAIGAIGWFVFRKLKANRNEKQDANSSKKGMDTEAVMATPVEPTIED